MSYRYRQAIQLYSTIVKGGVGQGTRLTVTTVRVGQTTMNRIGQQQQQQRLTRV